MGELHVPDLLYIDADEKLVRLLEGTPYSVQALGTFPLPTPD
jgi:hypothetical protein